MNIWLVIGCFPAKKSLGKGKDKSREFLKENPDIANEIDAKIRANSSVLLEEMIAPREEGEE